MIGQKVSHYKILKKIGQGGMSTVYLANDTKLSRKVALKFLPKELISDAVSNERFKREARAAALLNNPNIITIHEINEYQGRSYIVMEYVDGISLKEKIDQYRKTSSDQEKIKDIVITAIQICRGLEKAHQANIIHRDIKPGNILIDNDGQAIITDFGLAKLADLSKLTRDTSTLGTVHYMSPESIEGEEVDCRTDIWSFGVVLYEMICGQVPFKEDYLQALFFSIMNEEPTPISDLCEQIPVHLEKIVNRCVEKDASQRYSTISEVLSDLKNLKQNLDSGEVAIKSKKIRWIQKLYRKIMKRPMPLIISAALMLFILIPNPGTKFFKSLLFTKNLPAKKYLAVLPLINSSKDPLHQAYAKGTTARIIAKLTGLEQFHKNFWVTPLSELQRYKVSDSKKASESFSITLAITGQVDFDKDNVNHELNLMDIKSGRKLRNYKASHHITNLNGLQDGIIQEIVSMLDIKSEQKIENNLTAGGTSLPGAYRFYLIGLGFLQNKTNTDSIQQSIKMFNQAIEQDNSYDEAFASLSEANLHMYRSRKEKKWLENGKSYCNKALQISKQLHSVHITLGYLNREQGHYKKAVEDFNQALKINPECFRASLEKANIYYLYLKETKKAEDEYKNAIKKRGNYWEGFRWLAYFYYMTGRYPEAEDILLKVVDLNPAYIWAYSTLIAIYNKRGDENSARKAQEIFERSKKFEQDCSISSNMGTNLYFQKKYLEATEMYKKAIDLGKNHPNIFIFWGNLADSYRLIGGHEQEAQRVYREAVKLVQEKLVEQPDDPYLLSILAFYLAKLGEKDKALIEIDKALKLDPNDLEVLQNSIIVFELSGKRNQALLSLKEYIERQGAMGMLNRNPFLSELHQDPKYLKLVTIKNNF